MEEKIEARVTPQQVWKSWEKRIESGDQKQGKFKYRVLDVKDGESFSILWKSLFVRLIFCHSVKPTKRGSEICYSVEIKGLFAWPVRWLLSGKIRQNLQFVLRSVARELEK